MLRSEVLIPRSSSSIPAVGRSGPFPAAGRRAPIPAIGGRTQLLTSRNKYRRNPIADACCDRGGRFWPKYFWLTSNGRLDPYFVETPLLVLVFDRNFRDRAPSFFFVFSIGLHFLTSPQNFFLRLRCILIEVSSLEIIRYVFYR